MKWTTLWFILLTCRLAQACDNIVDNAAECGFKGSYACGVCYCNPPFFGDRCEIGSVLHQIENNCKESRDAIVCSRGGQCVNGYCICDQRDDASEIISGQFCECTNFLCDRYDGLLCGGADHGECECSVCRCKPGWTGVVCAISDDPSECVNPVSGDICSDNGFCNDQQCQCYYGYNGKWCEDCPTCRGQCAILKNCVYCHAFGGRSCTLSSREFSRDCRLVIEKVSSFQDGDIVCSFFDEDDCRYTFAYRYISNGQMEVMVQKKLQCPPPLDITPTSIIPGRHQCVPVGEFVISSDSQPEIPPGKKIRWTFTPGEDQEIDIHCPYINIPANINCRDDMLVISEASEHRRAQKMCSGITDFKWSTDGSAKVTFKRSDLSTEFTCKVACVDKGMKKEDSAEYQCPAEPPATPTIVTSCADLDEDLSGPCRCYDCNGQHVSLHCTVCQSCDLNIFAAYEFRIPIELEVKSNCYQQLDLTGLFLRNADKIRYAKICVQDNLIFPFSEFVNLEALVFQDCQKIKFGICQSNIAREGDILTGPTDSERPTRSGRNVSSSSSTQFIDTNMALPTADEVPNLIQLSLVYVNLTLKEGALNFPYLKELIIDSVDGLTVKSNAFATLTELEILIVTSCQEILESESFRLTSNVLKKLTIQNKCLHSLAPDAILLDPNHGMETTRTDKLTISIETESEYFDHIPMCPFRPLVDLEYVDLVWLSDLQCRSCGGIWYWELSPSQSEQLSVLCYDPVSKLTMPLRSYTDTNHKMCHFQIDYTGVCA